MNNRLTLMDGEVPLLLPSKVARERKGVPKTIPQQTSSYQKQEHQPKQHLSESKSALTSRNKPEAAPVRNPSFTQLVPNKSRTSYQAFMPLDQAGPATIARDNLKDGTFVAIKRVKRADRSPVYRTPDFTSEHLVNILDMFLEGDEEIAIVYEQMDVSLRHIVAVAGGPLQVFEIAAICKEVSGRVRSFW